MKPPEEVKAEFVRQWLGKAAADIRVCRSFLLTKGFHAQQAAEKALKAFLVWHQIEFSKSHDIEGILRLVAIADAKLAADVNGAKALTPYAVEYRYPGDLPEPTVSDIREAVKLAEHVLNLVLGGLPEEFRRAAGTE